MFKIRYKRDGNTIYAFFASYDFDEDYEYNWYRKLLAHFKNIFPHIKSEFIGKHIVKYLSEDKKYYGTAKCHPYDIFNEYKGKQLARHRLIMKYLRDVSRINSSICNHIRKELNIYD